jgi:tetratricopeptide (TPR) repeat protein
VRNLISAALIVRDEEKNIGACLESIAALSDEIVVVDTGSSDRSREIAAAHAARVIDYQWQDDFAAARNFAIDHATGEWILYIDADERVRPCDRRIVDGLLNELGLCSCTVRFHPRTGFTAYPEHRLFRRDARIRFRSAIHETILPDLNRIVAAGEGRIGSSGLTIDHLGYDGDQSHKAGRNLPLLHKQLGLDPERLYLWWHLGVVERDLGRLAEAEAAWQQGVDIARRGDACGPEIALCFIELAKVRLQRGEEALGLVREAKRLQPHNLLLHWIEAQALVAAGRHPEGFAIFARLASVDPDTLFGRVILRPPDIRSSGPCRDGAMRISNGLLPRERRLLPSRRSDRAGFPRISRQATARRGARRRRRQEDCAGARVGGFAGFSLRNSG